VLRAAPQSITECAHSRIGVCIKLTTAYYRNGRSCAALAGITGSGRSARHRWLRDGLCSRLNRNITVTQAYPIDIVRKIERRWQHRLPIAKGPPPQRLGDERYVPLAHRILRQSAASPTLDTGGVVP